MERAIATAAALVCCVLVAAGCAGSGSKQAARSTTTAAIPCVGCIDFSPTAAAIRLARSSNSLFSIFPAAPGKKACAIPAGGPGPNRLHGTCRTIVRPAPTHEPAFLVRFTETWLPRAKCPPPAIGCPEFGPQHHTWTIVEGVPVITSSARLHILVRRQSGTLAPQFWR
jgi:hypothetical protein